MQETNQPKQMSLMDIYFNISHNPARAENEPYEQYKIRRRLSKMSSEAFLKGKYIKTPDKKTYGK